MQSHNFLFEILSVLEHVLSQLDLHERYLGFNRYVVCERKDFLTCQPIITVRSLKIFDFYHLISHIYDYL